MLFDNRDKCLLKYPNLFYDEACLDIANSLSSTITIFDQYKECHKCNFQNRTTIQPGQNTSIVVNTRSPIELHYMVDNQVKCNFEQLLYEHYRYLWNITEKCSQIVIKQPADNAYLPILMAFVVLFCFGTVWYLVKFIYRNSGRFRQLLSWSNELEEVAPKNLQTSIATATELNSFYNQSQGSSLRNRNSSKLKKKSKHVCEDLGGSSPLVFERSPSIRKHPHRIKSIDVFRGLSIILMIFVNYGGGKYWFFNHSAWNGLTIADLVFPWFLWIMGLSLTVSLQSKLRRAVPRRTIFFHILRRSLTLIFLGVVINSSHHTMSIAHLRFPGVLQRIGITYFFVAILELIFTKRVETENITWFHDITQAWPQWLFIVMLTSIHTCLTFLVDIHNCGRGYLGPGGLDDGGKYMNCTGGVAGYIDRHVFGKHMYKHPACEKVYETVVGFDPEGILSTLTSILTVYLGVQAGRTLNTYQSVRAKVVRWIIWGIVTILVGAGLCGFSRDGGPVPLNKQLWSLSFTFVTAGMAFVIQASLFLLVDILRRWGGRPFFYPGMNAIILYVGHEILAKTFPFGWIPTAETHGAYLFMNLWGTFLWVSFSIYLYKHDTFFTI